jgi:hypothetical protein
MNPTHPPWWAWTVPLWPTLLAMAFVLLTGWLRGRSTGSYPTVQEWTQALLTLLQPMRNTAPTTQKDRPTGRSQQADPDEAADLSSQRTVPPQSSHTSD